LFRLAGNDSTSNLILSARFVRPRALPRHATVGKPLRKNKGAERRQAHTHYNRTTPTSVAAANASGAVRATQLRRYRRNGLRARSPFGAPGSRCNRIIAADYLLSKRCSHIHSGLNLSLPHSETAILQFVIQHSRKGQDAEVWTVEPQTADAPSA
jgi:hypothetical protein